MNMMNTTRHWRRPWVRWVLVIPAALGVWAGIQLFLAFLIIAPFYSTLMESLYGRWITILKEFVFYAVAPYWAIIAGAKTAPTRAFQVALVLAVLIIFAQFVLVFFLIAEGSEIVSWLIVGSIGMVAAVSLAVYQIKKGKTLLD